jgi:hypothetical protein
VLLYFITLFYTKCFKCRILTFVGFINYFLHYTISCLTLRLNINIYRWSQSIHNKRLVRNFIIHYFLISWIRGFVFQLYLHSILNYTEMLNPCKHHSYIIWSLAKHFSSCFFRSLQLAYQFIPNPFTRFAATQSAIANSTWQKFRLFFLQLWTLNIMCLNLYFSEVPFYTCFFFRLAAIYITCLGQTELCIVTSDWTAERECARMSSFVSVWQWNLLLFILHFFVCGFTLFCTCL